MIRTSVHAHGASALLALGLLAVAVAVAASSPVLLALALAMSAIATAEQIVAPSTVRVRASRHTTIDLRRFWYGARPFPVQERFLFSGHTALGCPAYMGLLGGRGLGKTRALARKLLLLALLNRGTREAPIWGAVCGRIHKEVWQKLLPYLLEDLTEIKREFGVDWIPTINKEDQTLVFPFGACVYLASYERQNSLQQLRGYTLGWMLFDEVEVAAVSADEILAVAASCIRDARARHSCLVWASTPNGLRGFARKHHEAFIAGDRSFWLVTGTCYDNPYLSPRQIAAMKKGLSKRLWLQEGLGVVLAPTNVVFGEFDEAKHVRKYVWDRSHKCVVSVDWGTSHAYIGIYMVTEDGTWWVVDERKLVDTTYPRVRAEVRDVVRLLVERTGEHPYAMACDGAVRSERLWLAAEYMSQCAGGVLWLNKDEEQRLDWTLALVSSLLDPADELVAANDDRVPAPIKLFLADTLDPTTDEAQMGIRGAFVSYSYAQMRTEAGELVLTNEPSKKNNADHPIDALRYAICKSRNDPALHGGAPLPFVQFREAA